MCKGAPLIIVQIATFLWMLGFTIKGAYEQFSDNKVIASIYLTVTIVVFILCVVSMIQVATTPPGHVTKQLVEKLKHQLLQPQQLDKLERIRDSMKARQFMLKSFNQAI